jgi:hypothetical protein
MDRYIFRVAGFGFGDQMFCPVGSKLYPLANDLHVVCACTAFLNYTSSPRFSKNIAGAMQQL